MPRALTVAGSDSGGGAGIQADLKTFAARGVWGASAVTAVTAQDSRGVWSVGPIAPALVRRQIEVVLADLGADAVKVGMLAGAATVRAVAAAMAAHAVRRLVVDPVLAAAGGEPLLAAGGVAALRTDLLPLAGVVTPNLDEAARLAGFPVTDVESMRAAAVALRRLGARAVVVTGGHLEGDAVDVLVTGRATLVLRARRIPTAPPHGTGCTFSAALAAELAKRAPIEAAVRAAKRYTTGCIRRAHRLGRGRPMLGHFARV